MFIYQFLVLLSLYIFKQRVICIFYMEEDNLFNLLKMEYRIDNKIRLHILGLPHTVTIDEFSHCAFTGKILRFPPMMKSVGYEVYLGPLISNFCKSDSETGTEVKSFDLFSRLLFISY